MDAETLIKSQLPGLMRFFHNKVGHEVDDLVQETLVRCIEALDRFEGSSFRAFTFGVARNVLYEVFRAKASAVGRHADVTVDSVADLGPGASTFVRSAAAKGLLLECLRQLPLEQQTLLELHYWEQMTGKEMAEALGIPEGTVWSQLRGARLRLAQRIERTRGHAPATDEDIEAWAAQMREEWQNPSASL